MKTILALPFYIIAFLLGLIGLFFLGFHMVFDCVAKGIKEM